MVFFMWDAMKKLYNFRLDPSLIAEVDRLGRSRTAVVTEALQSYLQSGSRMSYDVNIVSLLQREVDDLKSDKEFLKLQLVARQPLLQRVILRLRGNVDGKQ